MPWINHELGFALLVGSLYKILGMNGVLALNFISFLILFLVYKRFSSGCRCPNIIRTGILWLLISVLSYGLALRAQIFSYLFFALLLLIFESKNRKLRFFAPIILMLWANVHGGFFTGLAVTAVYAFFDALNVIMRKKPLKDAILSLLVFLLSSGATLITPYGISLWRHLLITVEMPRPYIPEWGPVDIFSFSFLDLKVLATAVLILIFFSKRIFSKELALLCLFTGIIAFYHNRHIPFFAVACAFLLPPHLDTWWDKIRSSVSVRRMYQKVGIFLYYSVSFMVILTALYLNRDLIRGLDVPDKAYPVNAVNFMKEHKYAGNCVVFFDWGEYMLWEMPGSIKVSFDGRFETVYPENVIKENFDFLYAESGWDRLINNYPADLILVHSGNPVAKHLMGMEKSWRLVISSDDSLLFKKM